jgi:hypothetical protein
MSPIAELWPFTGSANPGLALAAAAAHTLLAILAFWTARKARPGFWVAIGGLQALLALDAAFGFRVRVADAFRYVFQVRGLYESRHGVQAVAVLLLLGGAVVVIWWFRRESKRIQAAVIATGVQVLLQLIATVSLHPVEAFLRSPHPTLSLGSGLRCVTTGVLVVAMLRERKNENTANHRA